MEHMDIFAREGLRTLVVAQAEIDPRTFEEWSDQFDEVGEKNGKSHAWYIGKPSTLYIFVSVRITRR